MSDQIQAFIEERAERIESNGTNAALAEAAHQFTVESVKPQYSYNFSWMGRPIIQYPQDMVAMQEIIWNLKPDLIIETGIAHGGSLIYYASLLELLSNCGQGDGRIVGVDIDIREHNRREIENHPMAHRIDMIQGSSVDASIVEQVAEHAKGKERVLVVLDSNHTHEHALQELEVYAPMVSVGSYCVVFDTLIEDMPENAYPDRPWGPGNNPKTAVWQYIKDHPEFEIDKAIQNKLLISVAPDGYLKRVK